MAGKMTVLDRLMKEGRIKPRLDETMWSHADFRDPLNYTFAGRQYIKAHPESFGRLDITPERVKYQRGIEAIQNRNRMKAQNQLDDFKSDKELLQDQWNDAIAEAKDAMVEDWRTGLDDRDFSEIDPYYLEVGTPSTDLTDYWPDYGYISPSEFGQRSERLDEDISEWEDIVGHRESPEYRMELQRQSPRYRNYQRAMETRTANRRMGHQLSRMWGDAYNRLRARGLSDAEARMYLHDYFGGR